MPIKFLIRAVPHPRPGVISRDIATLARESAGRRAATVGHDCQLECGSNRIGMQVDAIDNGERNLLVDDSIATGRSAGTAVRLIERVGGEIAVCGFVFDLPDPGGRSRLSGTGHRVHAVCQPEAE